MIKLPRPVPFLPFLTKLAYDVTKALKTSIEELFIFEDEKDE